MRYVLKPAPTARVIKALPLGRVYYGEGLVLIVTPTARRWAFRYTSPITHRVTEKAIGPWPEHSYNDARKWAFGYRAMVSAGLDPVHSARKARVSGTTFAEACEGWLKANRRRWRSTRHIDTLLKHGEPMANVPVAAIDRAMVIKVLSPLYEERPEQTYRVSSAWARVFDYAETMGFREGKNPCTWRGNLEHVFHRPKNGNKHHASMQFADVPDFMRRLRLREVKGNSAAALEFLILTGARTNEVLGMRWPELDLTTRIWNPPPEQTEQKKRYRTPLSARCMEILELQQEYKTSEFVFTGYKSEALDEKSLRELLKRMDLPEHVTPHGFRASFRNWAARARINGERIDRALAEMCLGHSVKGKVEAAYWTDDALEERRPIMDAWAQFCCSAA